MLEKVELLVRGGRQEVGSFLGQRLSFGTVFGSVNDLNDIS